MSALRSFARAIRGMLADLKMAGSLEAVDAILSDIDGGFLQPPSDQSPAGGADHAA